MVYKIPKLKNRKFDTIEEKNAYLQGQTDGIKFVNDKFERILKKRK